MAFLTNQKLGKILFEITKGLDESKISLAISEFAKLVHMNKAIGRIDEIIKEFHSFGKSEAGISTVEVYTAREMDADFDSKLKNIFGQDLDIKYKIDPKIIGGIKIRIDNQIFDGSITNQLESLKYKLNN